MRYIYSIALGLVLGVSLLGASPAAAQTDSNIAKAKAAFTKGQQHYLKGDFALAGGFFLEAYTAKPIAAFLFNAAVAFEKAKLYEKAVVQFKRYLKVSPKSADATAITQRVGALEKAIAASKPPPRPRVRPGDPPSRRVALPPARAVVVPILPAIQPKGVVVISTKPRNATIYLNNKMKILGQSPWEGSLPSGEHLIIVEAKGYKPEKKTITVTPDRLVDLYIALSREHYLGYIRITSNKPGSLIYVDNKAVGAIAKTPYQGFLKPGKHTIWIAKRGYYEIKKEVEVVSGSTLPLHVKLQPLRHGWLTIAGATATGAQVKLNGKPLCRAPCDRKRVTPGRHVVEILKKGHKPLKKTIIVKRLSIATARVKLEKDTGYTQAIVAYSFTAAFLATGIGMGVASSNIGKSVEEDFGNNRLVSSKDPRFQRAKIFSYIANGMFGLAGLCGIFGVYYTFAKRGPKSQLKLYERRITITPEFGPTFAGLRGSYRF